MPMVPQFKHRYEGNGKGARRKEHGVWCQKGCRAAHPSLEGLGSGAASALQSPRLQDSV